MKTLSCTEFNLDEKICAELRAHKVIVMSVIHSSKIDQKRLIYKLCNNF